MLMSHADTSRDTAQARCAAFGLLAHAFRYPDDEMLDGLLDPAHWFSWPTVLAKFDAPAAEKLTALSTWVEENGQQPQTALSTLRDAYAALFGHAVRGSCPPYELEYARGEIIQQASELADISGFYNAFGMELSGALSERADHVAVECEFMSVLCAKEARVIESDDAAAMEICFDAQRAFLRDHLAQWLPAFARRIAEAEQDGFYGRLAQFASTFIRGEAQRFEIGVGPQWIELRPVDPARDSAVECDGSAGEDRLVPLTMGGSELVGAQ